MEIDVDELYEKIVYLIGRLDLSEILYIEWRKDRIRVYFIDDSFLDIWFSRNKPCKYAFHWERRHVDGSIYRWDNVAHRKYEYIETFPHHLHYGSKDNVRPFRPASTWEETIVEIINFIIKKIRERK